MIIKELESDQVPPSSQDAIVSETQDHVEGILFRSVNFYLNPFLGAVKVAELESILFRNGALKTSVMTRHESSTTHIITDDLDFPDYKHAKARGIHIVTPDWVYRSLSLNELLAPSRFSADPDHIFSGVVLTTTGLPQYDRQMIRDTVENFGGRYENGIVEGITHLIAIAASGDKYNYIMAHPELNVKIVLPGWFQYCVNIGHRLPETDYSFPDPPILDSSFDSAQLETENVHAPQLYANSVKSVVQFLNGPYNPKESQFLKALYFILAEDLNIIPDLRTKFVEKIENVGGVVLKGSSDYSRDLVDVVICRYRSGALYTQASMDGKTVGSADWLLHILQSGSLSSPKASLLHYPIPNGYIKGMTNLVITISNYTGPIREYIKRMILAVGATYKSTLSSQAAPDPTTHIICGNASGEKYEKGIEWNVKVVNHLWIEESFQSWVMQSETRPRYTTFPPRGLLATVFGSKLSPDVIEEWYLPGEEERADEYDVDMTAVKQEEKSPAPVKGVVKSKDIVRPPREVTPASTSSPSSKRMHTPPSEAENEQRQGKSRQPSSSSTTKDPLSPTLMTRMAKTTVASDSKSTGVQQKQAKDSSAPMADGPASSKSSTVASVSTPATSTTRPLSSAASTSTSLTDPTPAPAVPITTKSASSSSAKKSKEASSVEPQPKASQAPAEYALPRYSQRGAAMEAAKALRKIVPDMNTFQEELQNEKKASKRKKKTTSAIMDEVKEEAESSDMDVDDESVPKPVKAGTPLSPAKRKRVSIAPADDRSTPTESGEDEDENAAANSSRDDLAASGTQKDRGPAKKTKRATKAEKEKEKEVTAPVDSSESTPSTQAGANATNASTKKDVSNKQVVRFIATGLPKEPSAKLLKALKAIGISPTTSIERSTHLVAKGIARTEKFLVAVAQGKTIVHEDWLQACVDANAILDENDYHIRDSENEEKFGMDLYKSLESAREQRVFDGYIFYISPSVIPKLAALKTLVEAGGGRTVALLHTGLNFLKETIKTNKKASKKKDQEEEDEAEEEEETIAVISCEDDKEMWPSILEAKAHVYSHELIIQGILKQSVDLGKTHALA
ncbi:hypothetical protein BGZ83_001055 [Gryganskiella cystojenkinii]|nr:hypothetical protein BGZ83_001055 [Gryganskiella cystojenkinii]